MSETYLKIPLSRSDKLKITLIILLLLVVAGEAIMISQFASAFSWWACG